MTGSILVIAAIGILIALVIAGGLALRGSSGRGPKPEFLGAPPGDASEPLIRPESRHHDTPAGADLDTHGGREHGSS
jgi:hypothetical protein